MDRRRRLRGLPTDVYRAYDASGALLYVGMSVDAFQRLRHHRREAPWFHLVRAVRIEQYRDWRSARHVEGSAIKNEHPAWNGMPTWFNEKQESPQPIEVFDLTVDEVFL